MNTPSPRPRSRGRLVSLLATSGLILVCHHTSQGANILTHESFETPGTLPAQWQVEQGSATIAPSPDAPDGTHVLQINPTIPYGIVTHPLPVVTSNGQNRYLDFYINAPTLPLSEAENIFDYKGAVVALVEDEGQGRAMVLNGAASSTSYGEWLETEFTFPLTESGQSAHWLHFIIVEQSTPSPAHWSFYANGQLYARQLTFSSTESSTPAFTLFGDEVAPTYLDAFRFANRAPATIETTINQNRHLSATPAEAYPPTFSNDSSSIPNSQPPSLANSQDNQKPTTQSSLRKLTQARKRYLYIDNEVGSDDNQGRSALLKTSFNEKDAHRLSKLRQALRDIDGPKASLQIAALEAKAGDEIILFGTDTPYELEAIGTEGEELTITTIGNATISSSTETPTPENQSPPSYFLPEPPPGESQKIETPRIQD